MTKIKRCGLCLRVSTDRQAMIRDGSLDTQESRLKSYVLSRSTATEPWEVVEVYRGEGESGKDLNRSEFQRMLKDVRDAKLDVILVTKIDRLTRSLLDFFEVHRLFTERGVEFVSIDESFDTSSATGRAMLKIILVFAELERERTSERTKEKMRWRAEKGLWNGGQLLGYDLDPNAKGVPVPNEEEAELVRKIFQTYLETKSLRKTVMALNERGHRTKAFNSRRGLTHAGRRFTKSAVEWIIRNPAYVGKIRFKGEEFASRHLGIVPVETWEQANALIEANGPRRTQPVHRGSKDHVFILEGVLYCGRCGGKMVPTYSGTRGERHFYYQCCRRYNGVDNCPEDNAPAEQLEFIVTERIRRMARNKQVLEEAIRQALTFGSEELGALRKEREEMKRKAAQIGVQIRNLVEFVRATGAGEAGKVTAVAVELEDLERQKMSIDERTGQLEARIQAEEQQVVNKSKIEDACSFFDTVYEAMTPKEKRDLLVTFVRSITYSNERIRLELYSDPFPDGEPPDGGDVKRNRESVSLSVPEWLPALADTCNATPSLS